MTDRPNLIYTIAFDPPGSEGMRILARIMVSSLLRTYFSGEIVVFRNTPEPLFLVERKGLNEIFIPTPPIHGQMGAEFSWSWKYLAADYISHNRYEKIMFLDADCIALRNVDHLFSFTSDILYFTERSRRVNLEQFNCFLTDEEMLSLKIEGSNSGTLAMSSKVFPEVMQSWKQIDLSSPQRPRNCSDQASWNRLLIDTPFRKEKFETGEIQMPLHLDLNWLEYKDAAILHMIGASLEDKIQFSFGSYMQVFFGDPTALFLKFLDV